MSNQKKSVKVVVLGDIGRSPRMQYHALSLAKSGLYVDIIGYADTKPLLEITENENIKITPLYPLALDRAPKILKYVMKAIWQFVSLLTTLLLSDKSDYLICQNPPAIPTLPACWIYCYITKTTFFIDWHNYAYSIMALSLKPNHPLLKLSVWIEKFFGQKSQHNFCVTQAMKDDLESNWNIRAKVLYDRPPHIFRPITLEEKHAWYHKISAQYFEFGSRERDSLNLPNEEKTALTKTAFTQYVNGEIELRNDRPGIIFSSTSWTPDEDFSILLDALQEYESRFKEIKTLPKLICVITGKGPMKDYYEDIIISRYWKNISVITPWLEPCDYPTMVASADLGICLHTSSSGLDLPMKVVDMFGAGLPVCAYSYDCLKELVKNGINGYTFKNATELSQEIIQWFKDFPNNPLQNAITMKMKQDLSSFQELRWEENWDKRVKNFFTT